jgi:hypothetical protein
VARRRALRAPGFDVGNSSLPETAQQAGIRDGLDIRLSASWRCAPRRLNRIATPDEIASGIVFLASGQPGVIHGAVLPVDGRRLAVYHARPRAAVGPASAPTARSTTPRRRTSANACCEPYPADAHRHIGLIAEAVLAECAAIRAAVGAAMAAPGTGPESGQRDRDHRAAAGRRFNWSIGREIGAPQYSAALRRNPPVT